MTVTKNKAVLTAKWDGENLHLGGNNNSWVIYLAQCPEICSVGSKVRRMLGDKKGTVRITVEKLTKRK